MRNRGVFLRILKSVCKFSAEKGKKGVIDVSGAKYGSNAWYCRDR